MKTTKNNGDREILHEKIRIYSIQVRENLYSKTTETT